MKKLLFMLFAIINFSSVAQNRNVGYSVLQLSKTNALSPVELSIKPNKQIKIKTFDGRKFTFRHYVLVGDYAIASSLDTVALKDIKSIKGNVKGNMLRKIGGGVLTGVGGYFTLVGAFVGVVSAMNPVSPLVFLLPLPAIGVTYIGHSLAGARRFDTSERWTLHISAKPE